MWWHVTVWVWLCLRTTSISISITRTSVVGFQDSRGALKLPLYLYLNHSKTRWFSILVFFNTMLISIVFGCVPLLWAFKLQVRSKCSLPCDYTCVLAKSRGICPQSTYATTLLSLIQVSLLNLLSSFLITTTGSSWFLKGISYSFVSRTPQSPSTPKSGNICGRHYRGDKLMQIESQTLTNRTEHNRLGLLGGSSLSANVHNVKTNGLSK